MHIDEVKEILGLCSFLRAPKHIFLTDEAVHDSEGHYFRGLQPVDRRDAIFLSAQSNVSTIPHETWHANTGLGEITAYPVGNLAARKVEFFRKFPRLKNIRMRNLDYEEVTDSSEFPAAEKYGKRVRHFVLK